VSGICHNLTRLIYCNTELTTTVDTSPGPAVVLFHICLFVTTSLDPLECNGIIIVPHRIIWICTLAVDEWAVTYDTAKRKLSGAAARPVSSSLNQNNSTPINGQCTNYRNGPLLCGFNVPVKGLNSLGGSTLQWCSAPVAKITFLNAI